MFARRQPEPTPAPCTVNKRRHGRIRASMVPCSLGEVLDISISGLRIRARGKPPFARGHGMTITIATPAGLLAIDVGVAWARRVGWMHYEAGLIFVNPTPDVLEGIRSILRGCAADPL